MAKPDFNYYRTVVSTQNDPDILQSELKDLINECVAYIETEPVVEVPCSAWLSDVVFTEEYGVLSLRKPEGWLLWHSCKVDRVTLAELLKEAEENLKKLKETQDR